MRAELRKKVMAKYWAEMELVLRPLNLSPEKKKTHELATKQSNNYKNLQRILKLMPDEQFEAALDFMGKLPKIVPKTVKGALSLLPKDRGGRPADFDLETRRRAVQSVGHELPGCDSLREAIDVVASRYEMTPEYLRKVWKNRKRLRRVE